MSDYDPHSNSGPPPSPCVNICHMHPRTGLCEGCWRNIDEIAQWGTASDEVKRQVWRDIVRRREASDTLARRAEG